MPPAAATSVACQCRVCHVSGRFTSLLGDARLRRGASRTFANITPVLSASYVLRHRYHMVVHVLRNGLAVISLNQPVQMPRSQRYYVRKR